LSAFLQPSPDQADCVIIGAGRLACLRSSNWACSHQVPRDRHAQAAGGQCSELYPDKPIYDIPALPGVAPRNSWIA